MTTFGEYLYTNYSLVNAFVEHRSGIDSTCLHETIHLILTKSTSYGFFILLTDRMNKFDSSYAYIYKILFRHMQKLQEAICTFGEVIYYAQKNSYEETLIYLTNLKNSNKTYYKYISPKLTELLKYINPSSSNKLILSPEELFTIVYLLAKIALTCSLYTIPINIVTNKKQFKTFVEQKYPLDYIPNTRFNSLLKKLKKVLSETTTETYNVINVLNEVLSIFENKQQYLNIIINYNERYNHITNFIEKTKDYFKELFSHSEKKDLIYETINKFHAQEIDIDKIQNYTVPDSFKIAYKFIQIDEKELFTYTKDDKGIFFILGDNTYSETINSQLCYIDKSVFETMIKKYPDHILLIYFSYEQKRSFMTMYQIKNLNLLTLQKTHPIVINYKLTELINNLSKNKENKFYIYCDRPYATAIETINNFANEKKYAKIIGNQNLRIIVVQLDKNIELFLFVVSSLFDNIIMDIKNNRLNLEYDENLNIDLQQYDLIKNTLFYL